MTERAASNDKQGELRNVIKQITMYSIISGVLLLLWKIVVSIFSLSVVVAWTSSST